MESEKSSLVLPVLAALAAAIIGGALWALIVVLTEYEVGIVAWAIGGLAALAVSKFSKKVTAVHQLVAVIASLLGILLGKYFAFAYFLTNGLEGIFNSDIFTVFKDNFIDMFSGMDIVFVVLAVATAWQLPAKMKAKRPAPENGMPAE
ncbi:hypothetical protein DFP94_103382 [Fontibacillus phaseoli]|uniref:Uncharacterized protein n=1 Tax=Fontibacillus phaseoli TaxID=1416533 RepID=A0A369BGH1_9BACL|nr:hypothetical protein [Fontibacillus phaseoli]RCX20650.1 hypothetical protein DFP94_103382 [Fontibacillus phaseoli]